MGSQLDKDGATIVEDQPRESRQEIAKAFDEFMTAFEIFKETNDSRLASLEAGQSNDVLVEEKLARIERTLDAHETHFRSLHRPALGPVSADGAAREQKAALDRYVRKGDVSLYAELEEKGMSVGSEADGGYLVPPETESGLLKALADESPIRAISGTLTISTSLYKRPFAVSGAAAGWVGETGERGMTSTPQLAELAYPAMELYASPAATSRLLDDAVVDLESWLKSEITEAFANQEGTAFVSGDGDNKPKGFLAYPTAPAASAAWGSVGTVASGANGDFAAEDSADCLLELVFSLRAKYRKNARFVMNRITQSAIRRLKNADGDYLWQPTMGDGLETRLLGFPIVECEDMSDISPGAKAVAFGDFARGYLVVDRKGVQVLRDPYSAKPYILFYATKRVGGGMADFNAIRLLDFSAA